MKILHIQKGKYSVELDDEDYDRIAQFYWRVTGKKSNIQRSLKWDGISPRIMISMASEVMGKPGVRHDHIDLNMFNNQKNNLRPCTHGQNGSNTAKRKGCSSRFKGVTWNKANKCWNAGTQCNRKRVYLGSFKIEEDAARAYDKFAFKAFKGIALLNFPGEYKQV